MGREEELEWGQMVAKKGNNAISSATMGLKSVKVIAALNDAQRPGNAFSEYRKKKKKVLLSQEHFIIT